MKFTARGRPVCSNCPHFRLFEDRGECRIRPPALAGWPRVEPGDGCGAHPDFKSWLERQETAWVEELARQDSVKRFSGRS